MRSDRVIKSAVMVALAVAGLVLATPVALAGSLLSGYGGPGAGSQAILGSELVGGEEAGSGGGVQGAGPTSGGGAGQSGSAPASGNPRGSSSGYRGHAGSRHHGAPKKPVPRSTASGTVVQPAPASQALTLGLSGADVRDVLFGLIILALTAVFTGRVCGSPQWLRGNSAKGMGTSARVGD
jgi:hypothetical protein